MDSNLDQIHDLIHRYKIRHVSFDFWNTLAISNPDFKKERIRYFREFRQSLSVDEVENAFRLVSNRHNDRFLIDGIHKLQPCELYHEIFKELNIYGVDTEQSVFDIGSLFIQNPPLFTDVMNPEWMRELDTNLHITFSITSNTAFVEGKYIREVINSYWQSPPFAFMLFSDEISFGKPGIIILSTLYKNAQELHKGLKKYEVLHVGDNEQYDCKAADGYGFRHFKV